jgi:hypothetical protein
VNIVHTDGYPYLDAGRRIVKGFRRVGGGPGGWELKFAGRVWTLEDQGDGDTVQTAVTCFDPLKILEKRVVRNHLGRYDKQVQWWSPTDLDVVAVTAGVDDGSSGAEIIREAIQRTRDFGGLAPGESGGGFESDIAPIHIDIGGTWETTAGITILCDQMYIMELIDKITSTLTCDLNVTTGDLTTPGYLNSVDAVFMKLGAVERLGTDKSDTVRFAYATSPFTAQSYGRTKSLETLSNFVQLAGKSWLGAKSGVSKDTTSMDDFLVMEEVESLTDVENQTLLQYLADMKLALQKDPRELLTIVPTPEDSPLPWDDYWLGDTVGIDAADTPFPVTREAVEGVARLYGFTVSLDPDYGENVTEMVISPQDAAA